MIKLSDFHTERYSIWADNSEMPFFLSEAEKSIKAYYIS